jgi:lipopolysaccharide export system permease protein
VRERYLWELISPASDDDLAATGRFRAELHDRLLAPLYPIAFVLITYTFLGAPRTNRQNRGLSIAAAIGAVAALRLIGFASTIVGAHFPQMLLLQYLALAAASGLSIVAISRGIIIEPPAFMIRLTTALAERLAKRDGMVAAAQ